MARHLILIISNTDYIFMNSNIYCKLRVIDCEVGERLLIRERASRETCALDTLPRTTRHPHTRGGSHRGDGDGETE